MAIENNHQRIEKEQPHQHAGSEHPALNEVHQQRMEQAKAGKQAHTAMHAQQAEKAPTNSKHLDMNDPFKSQDNQNNHNGFPGQKDSVPSGSGKPPGGEGGAGSDQGNVHPATGDQQRSAAPPSNPGRDGTPPTGGPGADHVPKQAVPGDKPPSHPVGNSGLEGAQNGGSAGNGDTPASTSPVGPDGRSPDNRTNHKAGGDTTTVNHSPADTGATDTRDTQQPGERNQPPHGSANGGISDHSPHTPPPQEQTPFPPSSGDGTQPSAQRPGPSGHDSQSGQGTAGGGDAPQNRQPNTVQQPGVQNGTAGEGKSH